MSDPRPSYGRDGRRRPRGSRPRPGSAPRSYAVKQGTGTLLTCTGPCGLLVETIEIGTAGADLQAETFVCGACMAAEIWDGVDPTGEPTGPPSAPQGPPEALRVLVEHREPEEVPPMDLLALLGGPEGRRSAPISLVPRPPLPEEADDQDAEPVQGRHADTGRALVDQSADGWASKSLW